MDRYMMDLIRITMDRIRALRMTDTALSTNATAIRQQQRIYGGKLHTATARRRDGWYRRLRAVYAHTDTRHDGYAISVRAVCAQRESRAQRWYDDSSDRRWVVGCMRMRAQ